MVLTIRNQIYTMFKKAAAHNNIKGSRSVRANVNSLIASDFDKDRFIVKIPEKSINYLMDINCSKYDWNVELSEAIKKVETKQLSDVSYLIFSVEKDKFISDVLNTIPEPLLFENEDNNETVIVEFSSPNIAKPFHMGHLRSTVVGQFVANILSYSYKVIRVNYLGDWGTQFGLIQAGLKSMSLDIDNINENPLRVINEAYIRANQDNKLKDQAKIISSTLENTDESKELEVWKKLRELSINHLKETYQLLGIEFDEYTWESQYAKGFSPVLEQMKSLNLIEENKQLVITRGDRKIPLMKSDGTSLYLSRDILAALDRYDRHKCKSIKYVIDKSQEDHVDTLGYVVSALVGSDLVDHIKFGKIIGMSSRKGTSIFLSDILNKATELMAQQQAKSPNTRDKSFEVTQTLAITTLVVYLLKQRRSKDFTFDWDLALQSKGDSGVKLQYTHSRLCSLEKNCGVSLPTECNPQLITEPEAFKLVTLLDRFEQAIALSEVTLESSHLVNYAFKLCNLTSLCLKKLPVKGESTDTAQQRLLLFHKTRINLNKAMSVLGLAPLSSM